MEGIAGRGRGKCLEGDEPETAGYRTHRKYSPFGYSNQQTGSRESQKPQGRQGYFDYLNNQLQIKSAPRRYGVTPDRLEWLVFVSGDCFALTRKTYTVPTQTPDSKKPRLVTEAKCLILLVPLAGIELATFALRMRCSTN